MKKRTTKLAALFLSMAMAATPVMSAMPAMAATPEDETADTLSFNEPSADTSIKVRTWWPSANISDEQIEEEVKEIAEAGFGGIELIGITESFTGRNNADEKPSADEYGWASDTWNDKVEVLYKSAEKYGIAVDLTIGPRWPAGVPGLDIDGADQDAACTELDSATLHANVADTTSVTYDLPVYETTHNAKFVALVAAKTTFVKEGEVVQSFRGSSKNPDEYTIDTDSLTVVEDVDLENGTFKFAAPEAGDYTFFALYSVPTGGTSGDTSPTAYVIDHFSTAGTEAMLNYWEDNMITDSLLEHWENYGGDLFEDSLEVSFSGLEWSNALQDYFKTNKGYDITKYLPLLLSSTESYTADTDAGKTMQEEISNDFYENLSDMYIENHVKVVEAWCKSKNVKYRCQAQGTSDNGWVDSIEAQSYVDVVEGETLGMASSLDAWRSLAGAANMGGTEVVSVELGAEFGALYQVSWQRLNEVLNRAAMGGANQFVLHGFATDSQHSSSTKWPGWMPFDEPQFSEAWGPRTTQWDNMSEFTGYVSRLMSVLQYGTADVDFAAYRTDLGIRTDEGHTSGVMFLDEKNYPSDNVAMENGYVYNYISANVFDRETATVEDGVLNKEYAGYKALVVYDQTEMELEDAQAILNYAKAGLPIVLVGETPTVDGTYSADDDAAVVAVFDELKKMDNVASVDSEDQLVTALKSLGVNPSAQYEQAANLAIQHRTSADADLYYMYNYTGSYDYSNNATALSDEAAITMDVTLEGSGAPYQLDPWTGEITAIKDYTDNGDGTITLNITAKDGDPLIIGITKDASVLGEVTETVDTSKYEAETISLDDAQWTLDVTSYQPGESALLDSTDAAYNPNDVAKVALDTIKLDSLKPWAEIEGLENISGQGVYTTTVTLDSKPKSAVLDLGDTYDSILYVTVNGNVIDAIDQIDREVEIASYLKSGKNTIAVTTATTLAAAVRAAGGNCARNDSYTVYPTTYGLLGGISLTTYSKLKTTETTYEGDERYYNLISLFEDPDKAGDDRVMLRYWIPDAACTYEELKKEMTDLKEAGFGGVEIGNVPHNTYFDNSTYGWGSDNWIKLMANVLDIANELGDFRVDFTITAHWPLAVNTLDPNDDGAGKEATAAYVKVTADDIANGTLEVPMPTIKTADEASNPFIFKYDLISANVAQVTAVNEDGTYSVDTASMKTVETTKLAKTTVAGIPKTDDTTDAETVAYIKSLYGGELPDTSIFYEDSAGNPITDEGNGNASEREPLADTQNYYAADVSGLTGSSNGEDLQVGDWVLYGVYMVGTGDNHMSNNGFIAFQDAMPGVNYCVDLFSAEGVDYLTGYWDEMFERAEGLGIDLKGKMEANPGSVFEDSLENSVDTNCIFWSKDMIEEFKTYFGYDITPYLPYLTAKSYTVTSGGWGAPATTTVMPGIVADSNDDTMDLVATDFNEFLSDIYVDVHVADIEEYYNQFGWAYRGQGYCTTAIDMDTSAVSSALDQADVESLAWTTDYDRFRTVATSAHLSNHKYVCDEALANMMQTYQISWESAISTINANFAAGATRMIIHGTSYAKTIGNVNNAAENSNQWPGWHTFGSVFADPWGSRMAYWDDVDTMTEYISRTQAILQNGDPSVDLLVYDMDVFGGRTSDRDSIDQSSMKTVLDNGYTYDITTTDNLTSEYVDDIGYKAIVINNQEDLPMEGLDIILDYVKSGMPVIFVGETPSKSMSLNTTDEEVQAAVAKILKAGAVQVADQDALVEYLKDNGMEANASYSAKYVRTVRRVDNDGSVYYYVLNNSDEDQTVTMTLKGGHTAYDLDAWNGEITQIAYAEATDDGCKITLNMESGEATIIATTNDTTDFPATNDVYVTSANVDTQYNAEGKVVARSTEDGKYTVSLSDGTSRTFTLDAEEPSTVTGWSLSLESWGPDAEANVEDPTVSKKTTVDLGAIDLASWENIPVSQETLDTFGVTSMGAVSGIGTYTTHITSDGMDGAYLVLEHGADEITAITVNGHDLGHIDQSKLRFDIGEYMVEGDNVVTVKVVSTMHNRVIVENSNYNGQPQAYGITSATLIPYDEQVVLTNSQECEEILAAAKAAQAAAEEAQKAAEEALAEAQAVLKDVNASEEKVEAALEAAQAAKAAAEAALAEAQAAASAADQSSEEAKAAQAAAEEAIATAKAAQTAAEAALNAAQELKDAVDITKAELQKLKDEVLEARNAAKFIVKKMSLRSAKSTKKGQIKVTFKGLKKASGYIIKLARNSHFNNAVLKSTTKTSVTVKSLKSHKKYYVKVKAFIKLGGHKYYTGYSKVKKVVVK